MSYKTKLSAEKRADELGISELHQGIHNKLEKLKEIAEKYDIKAEEIAYIGDDLNDLECINYCSLTACPGDAMEDIMSSVSYVCKKSGGRGAVRELIDEKILGK